MYFGCNRRDSTQFVEYVQSMYSRCIVVSIIFAKQMFYEEYNQHFEKQKLMTF